jgi:hypothetical protein
MAVRCSKCGEELLGAVNRCWKCGQSFALRPEIDGRPPVRAAAGGAAEQPLDAVVLDDAEAAAVATQAPTAAATAMPPLAHSVPPRSFQAAQARPVSTADLVDARRASVMALGGMVASLVLAVFALALAPFRFEAAVVALLGLIMGIWGLYSPRRRWAFAAMLLCCLAIALGSYTGVRQLYDHIQKNRPVEAEEESGDSSF